MVPVFIYDYQSIAAAPREEPVLKVLAHVCFTVRDLHIAMCFYVDALGFKHAFDFINDEGGAVRRVFPRVGPQLHRASQLHQESLQSPFFT
ncbi:MAG: VOC family protein [Armatimonadota bacterium]